MCVGRGVVGGGKKRGEDEAFVLWVFFWEEEEDTTAVTIRKRLLTVGIYLAYHFLPTPPSIFSLCLPHLTTQFI